MAIDPLLYEKVSGRSGNPHERLGSALAGAEKSRSARLAQLDVPIGSRMTWSYYKYKIIFSGVGVVLVIIATLIYRLFGR
jgi:hypothetical protein